MEYPVLAIEPRGLTQMMASEEYWASMQYGFVGLFAARVDRMTFYSKSGEKWKLVSIRSAEKLSLWTKLFQPGIAVRVIAEFQPQGIYGVEELRASLVSAVQADDDILAQYYSHEQIHAWLQDAKSIAKLFSVYRWITKEFGENQSSKNAPEQAAEPKMRRKQRAV